MPGQADFGDDRLDGHPRQAVDLGQSHTGHRIPVTTHIAGRCMPRGCVPSPRAGRYGVCREVDVGCEGRGRLRDLLVTGGELVIDFSGLTPRPRHEGESARGRMKALEIPSTFGHGLLHTHNPQLQEEPMAAMTRAPRREYHAKQRRLQKDRERLQRE
jgi:hypothetical protein